MIITSIILTYNPSLSAKTYYILDVQIMDSYCISLELSLDVSQVETVALHSTRTTDKVNSEVFSITTGIFMNSNAKVNWVAFFESPKMC